MSRYHSNTCASPRHSGASWLRHAPQPCLGTPWTPLRQWLWAMISCRFLAKATAWAAHSAAASGPWRGCRSRPSAGGGYLLLSLPCPLGRHQRVYRGRSVRPSLRTAIRTMTRIQACCRYPTWPSNPFPHPSSAERARPAPTPRRPVGEHTNSQRHRDFRGRIGSGGGGLSPHLFELRAAHAKGNASSALMIVPLILQLPDLGLELSLVLEELLDGEIEHAFSCCGALFQGPEFLLRVADSSFVR
jgi:hypothetical protein